MRIVNPIGKKGEDIAVEYLKKKGYKIIERNFRKGYGEIDIICVKKNVLVFVEVKTRTSDTFGTPLESITPWKLKPLIKTAQYYSMLHPELPDQLRLDAISVILEGLEESIEHLENISGF
ncbi:MAG TPA: YraN family protein [Candidatus Eisenbacteria bacterium]|nr:YraN family protein [Candidatus Eisenbacteria bacterium]